MYFKKYVDNFKNKIEDRFLIKIKNNFSTFKNKAKTLEDIYNNSSFLFKYDKIDLKKTITPSELSILIYFYEKIKNLNENDLGKIKSIIDETINEKNIKFKEFGQPVRLALTGTKYAPSINEIINSLGIEEVKLRLSQYL